MKKAVLKNFAIFTVKHLCWSLFLIKLHLCYLETVARKCYVKREVFYKKAVHKIFPKFIGKHLCRSLFINKVQLYQKGNSDTDVILRVLQNF